MHTDYSLTCSMYVFHGVLLSNHYKLHLITLNPKKICPEHLEPLPNSHFTELLKL